MADRSKRPQHGHDIKIYLMLKHGLYDKCNNVNCYIANIGVFYSMVDNVLENAIFHSENALKMHLFSSLNIININLFAEITLKSIKKSNV